jgi:tRNA threonylcarbamoyl adenosine modification protein (Sua5/YciO/YrdC/YwlC family)
MLLEINPVHPEPRKIRRAVDALQAGDIVAYPTDTVYGMGCDLFNRKAIDRLYQLKGIDKGQKLAFLCGDLADVSKYAMMHQHVYRALKQHLPGPYTFILEASRDVPKIVQSNRRTVGVRIPDSAVVRALILELGAPILSTTAARHGEDPSPDPHDVDALFPGLALVLDGGPGALEPTSVVDLTGDEPVVIRRGVGDVSAFEH